MEFNLHATWLVKDDKELVSLLDHNVYQIAEKMGRNPLGIIDRLRSERVRTYLQKAKPDALDFDYDCGSEEEAEFKGLVLSGVPLVAALKWCLALDDRPENLESMMTQPDFRPSTYLARDLGIWFAKIEQMDDMRFLADVPEIARAAVEDVIQLSGTPTVQDVMNYINGEADSPAPKYPWVKMVERPMTLEEAALRMTSTPAKKVAKGRGRRKSYTKSYYSSSSWAYKKKAKSRKTTGYAR